MWERICEALECELKDIDLIVFGDLPVLPEDSFEAAEIDDGARLGVATKSSPGVIGDTKRFDRGGHCEEVMKVLIVGAAESGKTALMHRYCQDVFSPNYISTIGIDFQVIHIESFGIPCKVQLWDSAGQERFRTITQAYYRGCTGVIVCVNVWRKDCLKGMHHELREIDQYLDNNECVVVVGTHADNEATHHKVTTQELEHATREAQHAHPQQRIEYFGNVSSKTGEGVDHVMHNALGCMAAQLRAQRLKENEGKVKLPSSADRFEGFEQKATRLR